jgi:hypothetical protein
MQPRYNKNNLLKVLELLPQNEIIPFLQAHQSDLHAITEEKEICDIIFYTLNLTNNVGSFFSDQHQNNLQNVNAVLKLFAARLSFFTDIKLLTHLLSRFHNDVIPSQRSKFDGANVICAQAMRSAILSIEDLTRVTGYFDKYAVGNFIKEQEKYWAQNPILQTITSSAKSKQTLFANSANDSENSDSESIEPPKKRSK